MKFNKRYIITLLMATVFIAGCKKKEALIISNDWISETIPGSRVSACYLLVTNNSGKDEVLLRAESENFELVEFHNMVEENGLATMEALDYVTIKDGETVEFSPGGLHLMLINNKKPLKSGDAENITFYFQNAGPVTRKVVVKNFQEQVK